MALPSRRNIAPSQRRPWPVAEVLRAVAETAWNVAETLLICRGDTSELSRRHHGLSRRHFSSVAETARTVTETFLICRGDTVGCRGDTSHVSRRRLSAVAETPRNCRGDMPGSVSVAETPRKCRGDSPGEHGRRGDAELGPGCRGEPPEHLDCRGDAVNCRGDTAAGAAVAETAGVAETVLDRRGRFGKIGGVL